MPELRPGTVLLLAAAFSACGGSDPEREVRELVAEAQAAAESRSTGYFRDLISDDYADARGLAKDELVDRIRGFFVVNQTVEVSNRIDEIVLEGADVATVTMQTTLGGPRAGAGLFGAGEPYRVDVELTRIDGDWHVIGAEWQPATR